MNLVSIKCSNCDCNKIFQVEYIYRKRKFCSKSCNISHQNRQNSHPSVEITCKSTTCNKKFTVPYKHRNRKFCCFECSVEFNKNSEEINKKKSVSHLGIKPAIAGKTMEEFFGEEKANDIKAQISIGLKKSRPKKEKIIKEKKKRVSSMLGKKMSLESRLKMSEAKRGKIRTQTEDEKRNRRIHCIEKINERLENGLQMIPNWNPRACDYFEKFDRENNTLGRHARNGGEYYIKELGYWVDYINHDLKLIIEYDERKHFDVYGNLKQKDVIREKEIKSFYEDYSFVRIKDEL